MVLSAALLLGFANGILLIALWVIYLSFVHIGQDWYSYGWEIQLLETGFLGSLSLPPVGRPAVPKTAAASASDLVVPMVDFQNHARGWLDQASRRFLLAGSHLSLLSL